MLPTINIRSKKGPTMRLLSSDLTLRDFQPCCNAWAKKIEVDKYGIANNEYLYDRKGANREHWDFSPAINRLKCLALATVGTPIVLAIAYVVSFVFAALKLVTFANFWMYIDDDDYAVYDEDITRKEILKARMISQNDILLVSVKEFLQHPIESLKSFYQDNSFVYRPSDGEPYQFRARLFEAADDLFFLFKAIPCLIGCELSALYGIAKPFDGAKLYASFEVLSDRVRLLAPCFQANAEKHGLNGNAKNPNAW